MEMIIIAEILSQSDITLLKMCLAELYKMIRLKSRLAKIMKTMQWWSVECESTM